MRLKKRLNCNCTRVLMVVCENDVRECEGRDLGTCENDCHGRNYVSMRNESM